MTKIIKISYENWLSSAQKWVEAIKRTEAGEPFTDSLGFDGLPITVPCGYCNNINWSKEFFRDNPCDFCILHNTEIESILVCYQYGHGLSYFGRFCLEMQEDHPNFKIALSYAKIILKIISSDCPDRKQATKDGIIFPIETTTP